MSAGELWFWAWTVLIGGLTLTSVFRSIFYYRHEARRQIELAKAGFNPNPVEPEQEQSNG